jgi:hypothetical protein
MQDYVFVLDFHPTFQFFSIAPGTTAISQGVQGVVIETPIH